MPDFSVKAVGERLAEAWGGASDRDVAKRLKDRVKWRGSREKVRRARAGQGETIAHDLVAATAIVYGADPTYLLTGVQIENPAPRSEERGISFEPIGDAERLDLLRLIRQVEDALHRGPQITRNEPAIPTVTPKTVKPRDAGGGQRDAG